MEKIDIVIFNDDELSLEVKLDKGNDTVWLTQEQIVNLFGVDRTSIIRHIRNIYSEEELDEISTCAKTAKVQLEANRKDKRTIKLYNLDMIISIGYRVRSKRGVLFRKWARQSL